VNISYATPKNLIIIYVESLEKSYQNADVFGRNLLAKLDTIDGFSFEAFSQAPGTGWTIAGLTATQCGVPLKNVSLYDGNDQGENIKSFLPSAVCLGDILNRAGYYNVYMGGASSNFSGKGKFFNDHHYDEVLGREELMTALNITDTNYWGLYDDDLLIAVKDKIKHLYAQKNHLICLLSPLIRTVLTGIFLITVQKMAQWILQILSNVLPNRFLSWLTLLKRMVI